MEGTRSHEYDLTSKGNREPWDRVVDRCPWGKFFHKSAWIDFLERYGKVSGDFQPCHIIYTQEGEMTGALPLFVTPEQRGLSLPLGDYGGPVIAPEKGKRTVLRELLDEIPDLASIRLKAIPRAIQGSLDGHGFSVRPYSSTFRLDLEGRDEGGLFQALRRDGRRGINKAKDKLLVAEARPSKGDAEGYMSLHQDTSERLSTPERSYRFFKLLWERLLEPGFARATFACLEGERVAGVIVLYDRDHPSTLHIYSNVSREKGRDLHANDLLYWEIIEWALDNGFKEIDMGLSPLDPQHGLCVYKRKWGTERSILHLAEKGKLADWLESHLRSLASMVRGGL